MTDLATRYLGLDLRSPLVASASPLSGTADGVRRLADGGVGAVVLPSLFPPPTSPSLPTPPSSPAATWSSAMSRS